jgi:lipoprotein
MKFIDKMILCVFSVLMLLIAIFSCACIFGWIEVTNLYLLATKALADKTMCNILLGLNAVLIIMALKGIFFESNTEEEKGSGNGILLENDDGKLLITKETLTSIVNSVVAGFESVQGQQTRITLDENNDLSILLTIEVSDKAVIKELSNNIQIRVKDAIKKSLDVEVKSLDIKVKDMVTPAEETKEI